MRRFLNYAEMPVFAFFRALSFGPFGYLPIDGANVGDDGLARCQEYDQYHYRNKKNEQYDANDGCRFLWPELPSAHAGLRLRLVILHNRVPSTFYRSISASAIPNASSNAATP